MLQSHCSTLYPSTNERQTRLTIEITTNRNASISLWSPNNHSMYIVQCTYTLSTVIKHCVTIGFPLSCGKLKVSIPYKLAKLKKKLLFSGKCPPRPWIGGGGSLVHWKKNELTLNIKYTNKCVSCVQNELTKIKSSSKETRGQLPNHVMETL